MTRIGESDLRYADAASSLAKVVLDQQRYEEARELLTRSLELRTAIYPDGHPFMADTHLNLGSAHQLLGDHEAATLEFAVARELLGSAEAPDLAAVAMAAVGEGLSLVLGGEPAYGEDVVRAALEQATLDLGAEHWMVPYCRAAVGLCEVASSGEVRPGGGWEAFDAELRALRDLRMNGDAHVGRLAVMGERFETRYSR